MAEPAGLTDYEVEMPRTGFIAQYALWSAEQRDAADRILTRIREGKIRMIRVGSVDPQGKVRAKAVTASWFPTVIEDGIAFSSAQFEFDSAEQFVRDPFRSATGAPSAEPSGLPDMVLVPDPSTFRELPWTSGTAWMLGDMYSMDGSPVSMDSRRLLKVLRDR